MDEIECDVHCIRDKEQGCVYTRDTRPAPWGEEKVCPAPPHFPKRRLCPAPPYENYQNLQGAVQWGKVDFNPLNLEGNYKEGSNFVQLIFASLTNQFIYALFCPRRGGVKIDKIEFSSPGLTKSFGMVHLEMFCPKDHILFMKIWFPSGQITFLISPL